MEQKGREKVERLQKEEREGEEKERKQREEAEQKKTGRPRRERELQENRQSMGRSDSKLELEAGVEPVTQQLTFCHPVNHRQDDQYFPD